MAGDLILEIRNLCAGYGRTRVLDGVDLMLRRGQLASLIGPNGAGKSTLLHVIAGLLPVESGTIVTRSRRLGFVPQQLAVEAGLPLTVREFLDLKHAGGRRIPCTRRETVLGEIGAGHLARRRLGELSGGEFQRVMVAYALLDEPDLLLLDEPLTGVDFRGGMSFHRLLHHLHDERGLTVLMVSHDMHLVEHMSQEIFCLNRVICCHGPPDHVLTRENLEHAFGHHGD
jgi:zinc transport system ATP-binding protein